MKILIKSHLLLIKGIFFVDLDKMNLDNDNDFDEDDPDTIIPVRLWLGIVNLKNEKHIKQVNE